MFFINQRSLRYFDWTIFILTISLASIGLLFIFSSTFQVDKPVSIFFKKQIFGFLTGIAVYFAFSFLDQRKLLRISYFIYFLILAMLLFTIIKGTVGMGAKRWINLFYFKFQPSELAKLFLPAFTAYYFYTQNENFNYTLNDFKSIIFIILISFLLILRQPDLGTAIIILISGFVLLWFIGLSKKFFIVSLMFFIFTSPFSWKLLKPYQKNRIKVFFGSGEKTKERYQIEQSQIAIGSGGIKGKGFLNGTQNRFYFLPESQTDFIYAVICEEMGFLGGIFILVLYILLFFRIFKKQQHIKNVFFKIIVFGLLIHIFLSTFINIGMVIGLLPIVGIPLPLLSYGITSLWITMASIGWINGIIMQNHKL